MRSILRTLVFVGMAVLTSKAAIGAPVLLYEFTLTSYTCATPGRCGGGNFQQALEDMTIGLSPSALANGEASLSVYKTDRTATTVLGEGIDSALLALFYQGPYKMPSIGETLTSQNGYLVAYMNLLVGQYLSGSMSVNDSGSDIFMSTSGSTPFEWIGQARSDFGSPQISYTGYWQFSRVVPEPGTLALLATAFSGVALVSMRRRRTMNRSEF